MKFEVLSGIVTCGILALSVDARAAGVTTAGTSFVPSIGNYEQYLERLPGLGIANVGSVDTVSVMGSVYHSVAPNGIKVYFDGLMASTNAIMWCNVTSLNWDGTPLVSQNIEVTGYHGSFEVTVSLTSAQVPYYAFVTADCGLPINQQAWLYGVTSANL